MSERAQGGLAGRERVEARFERLYADHGRAVLAYAVRRSPDPQDGADVLAETFLIAWRRVDDIPAGDGARLWLYGVARNVLANQQRSERRRGRLGERLRRELPQALTGVPPTSEAGAIGSALAELDREDQEILRLCGWEELTPSEIATVLGISQVAARSRLHRARHRLRAALERSRETDDCTAFHFQEA